MAVDKKTLDACRKKIQDTLDNLDRMEKRFTAYCDFYLYGLNTFAEREALERVLNDYIQPMKDICILNGLLNPEERQRMPAIDKTDLRKRQDRAIHEMYLTLGKMHNK